MKSEDQQNFALLKDEAKQLLKDKVPFVERNVLLRAMSQEHGFTIRDNELMGIVASARKELRGGGEGISQGQELYIPENKWAWESLIAERTFNVITALPKVGKSAFIAALISSWKYGDGEFLGHKINGDCPPVIIAGTDQPLCDWQGILHPAGLMKKTRENHYEVIDPIVKLWHRGDPIHLDEAGIEQIERETEKYRNALIVGDAFASLISPLGLNENSEECVEPIHNLLERIDPYGATLALIHHSSRGNADKRASMATRGTGALPAAASQLIQLEHFSKNKTDHRVKVSTEGRNSRAIDLVVEQVDRSQWISHGTSADIEQDEKRDEQEAGLIDRQVTALAFLRDFWENSQKQIDPTQLAELMKDDLGDHPRVQARSTLDQLVAKGLAEKTPDSDPNRGKVVFYRPI